MNRTVCAWGMKQELYGFASLRRLVIPLLRSKFSLHSGYWILETPHQERRVSEGIG